MFQEVTLVGNVGRVEDVRFTQSGKQVTNFSLAINEGSGDNKTTLWVRVTCWEKLADIVTQYVTKGRQVLVVGRLAQPNAYLTKDGKPAAAIEVTAATVRLLGSREDGGTEYHEPVAQVAQGNGAPAKKVEADDVPF
jgi:single-strand DNA-binding protein